MFEGTGGVTTSKWFDGTNKAETIAGLDVVTEWFDEAVTPAPLEASEMTAQLIIGIVDTAKAGHPRSTQERARQQGVKLPEKPPAQGMQQGSGMGFGPGKSQGGSRGRGGG